MTCVFSTIISMFISTASLSQVGRMRFQKNMWACTGCAPAPALFKMADQNPPKNKAYILVETYISSFLLSKWWSQPILILKRQVCLESVAKIENCSAKITRRGANAPQEFHLPKIFVSIREYASTPCMD